MSSHTPPSKRSPSPGREFRRCRIHVALPLGSTFHPSRRSISILYHTVKNKISALRPYPQDEAAQDLDVGRAKKAMPVFGREFSSSTLGAHAAPIGTVTRTLTSGRAPQ